MEKLCGLKEAAKMVKYMDMSNTSIDGLKRRNPGVKTPVKAKTLEAPLKKKELKTRVQESNKFEPAKKEVKSSQQQAVKEFFNTVKDENPTDLVDIPKKEQKKKKRKKHKVLKRVILVIILLLIIAAGCVYGYFNDFIAKVTDGGSLLGFLTSDPDTPLQKDENGRTNILIFGTEGFSMDDPQYDGGWLTDSMMLLSINQDTGDAKTISLPRDLKAVKTCTATGKLNEVYFCEYQKAIKGSDEEKRKAEAEGARKLAAVFEDVLGIKVHYRAHANWGAVTKIVDAIGGIDVVFTYGDQTWDGDETVIKTTSPKGLADNYRKGKYAIQYPNGQAVHLGGWEALNVARVRNAHGGYGAASGNFSREYFQQRILEAIVNTAKKKNITSDIFAVMQIKDAVGDNLRTDIKDTELKSFIKLANTVNMAKIETISLYSTDDKPAPLMTTGMINKISYVFPSAGVGNYDSIRAYIKRKFSAEPFTAENAQVAVLNGTAAYGIASKEKTVLENKGCIVKSTGNAPSDQSGFDGVRVFQKNKKMTKTAEALKKLYKVDVSTEIPDSLKSTEADFIVIIGNGFSHSK